MTSADSNAGVERLAREQAALRRVAVLVARESSPEEVFEAVTQEAAEILSTEAVGLLRFEPDERATLVAQSDTPWDPPPLGTPFALDGENVVTQAYRTGEAARMDDWANATGALAAMADVLGVRSCVATPITVEGRTWGVLIAATSQSDPLPPDTQARVQGFTELVATAIANAEARGQLSRLANEQAGLRRVATLVARGATPEGVFRAVAAEVGVLFGGDVSAIVRFEADGTATVLGDVGGPHVAGKRVALDPGYVVHTVRETSRSARFDTDDPSAAEMSSLVRRFGIRSAVASPIVVEGELWGAITAGSQVGPLASSAERRLTEFTELVAAAVANTQARNEVTTLAKEQAALRRVATLVAQGVPARDIFSAVSQEVARLFGTTMAAVGRFDPEEPAIVIVGAAEATRARIAIGSRLELDDAMVAMQVYRTGRSARVGRRDGASIASLPPDFRGLIARLSAVGSPIVVDGRLWGVLAVNSEEELPPDTQHRLESFTELVAIAVANAETRAELTASRARIVAASDDARRRIERDLHDGAQQRLVSLGLELRIAAEGVPSELTDLDGRLERVADEIDGVIDDLREMSRGIHPAVLSDGGLGPAIETLARRATVPVELVLGPRRRFAEPVEVAAYYVVSEALTNTAKHANASRARVLVDEGNGSVRVSIDDDGDGGAQMEGGSGLAGLRDRVEALGGSFRLSSPSGRGTVVTVELPVGGHGGRPAA